MADSFGTFLDTLQRLRSQQNRSAGAANVQATGAALLMTVLASQKDPMSVPDLMAKTSLDPVLFAETYKQLLEQGLITVSGQPPKQLVQLEPTFKESLLTPAS
jgi:hypothetical protein